MRSSKTSRQLPVRVPAVCLERTCMLVCHPEQPERPTRRNYGFIKRRSRALSAGVVAPIPRRLGLTRERNFRDTLVPFAGWKDCSLCGAEMCTCDSPNYETAGEAEAALASTIQQVWPAWGPNGPKSRSYAKSRRERLTAVRGALYDVVRRWRWHDCSPRHSTLERLIVKHITF